MTQYNSETKLGMLHTTSLTNREKHESPCMYTLPTISCEDTDVRAGNSHNSKHILFVLLVNLLSFLKENTILIKTNSL